MTRIVTKPLKLNKATCKEVSSNCITWQGPSITCINLCKGDSITEVIYELATEFCNLYEQLNPEGYDLECLDIQGCPPDTIKELIQLMLDKLCDIEENVSEINVSCAYEFDTFKTQNTLGEVFIGGSDYANFIEIPSYTTGLAVNASKGDGLYKITYNLFLRPEDATASGFFTLKINNTVMSANDFVHPSWNTPISLIFVTNLNNADQVKLMYKQIAGVTNLDSANVLLEKIG